MIPRVDGATEDAMPSSVTFVVRAVRRPDGRLAGVVERVRSGETHRFDDRAAIGRLIEQMVDDETPGT
jgi:hypothetical protein